MSATEPEPTHLDRATRDLGRSEERFRLLVESVIDYAIFVLDPDGVVQTWNPGAERLKGYRPEEIVGRHYSTFYPAQDRADGLPDRLLARARAEGRAEHSGWRVRKDGSRFWANVVITALVENGVLAGFAKVTRDMTELHLAQQQREQALEEQRRALERLERLDDWRRDFVRAVVHDLQSPTTAIRGFADLIADPSLAAEDVRDLAGRIGSNAASLQSLLDHLRTWALLESGNVELDPEPIELRRFVGELVGDLQPVLEDRDVGIDAEPVTVTADRRGLERVLRNLLTNAARHTPAGAAIRVRVRREDRVVILEVEDEGEGMPEALVPQVFDRFERGVTGGTGLGLAIVKEYVELHGGTVEVRSAPGQGATFVVRLPVGAPAGQVSP